MWTKKKKKQIKIGNHLQNKNWIRTASINSRVVVIETKQYFLCRRKNKLKAKKQKRK